VNKPKDIEKMENGAGRSEAERKPKKRLRVSQRKELAVVTVGMVATIASFGGLLAGYQAQAEQPANETPPAQSSSTTPGSSSSGQSSNEQASAAQVTSDAPDSSSSGQPSKQQAPAYSPATQSVPAQAPHAQSQGS
jgi:cytoskeletal protein RodZ